MLNTTILIRENDLILTIKNGTQHISSTGDPLLLMTNNIFFKKFDKSIKTIYTTC